MATEDWVQDSKGRWYYVDSDGNIVKGWMRVPGTSDQWYYFDKDTGERTEGWIEDNGKWYYLDDNKKLAKGWGQIDNE